jgi:hypothetical protein
MGAALTKVFFVEERGATLQPMSPCPARQCTTAWEIGDQNRVRRVMAIAARLEESSCHAIEVYQMIPHCGTGSRWRQGVQQLPERLHDWAKSGMAEMLGAIFGKSNPPLATTCLRTERAMHRARARTLKVSRIHGSPESVSTGCKWDCKWDACIAFITNL